MKTAEEIEARLSDAIAHQQNAQSWNDDAYKRYQNDKKAFGEADFAEVDQASSELREINKEVSILKWVLT